MRLSLLLAFLFTSTVALAADRQINQISVEQSDSGTIIRLFGSDLIRSPKDRVFFAAEASSYSVEPAMMYGDSEYVEVALGMPVMAGQYRISIGPNENTSTLESMVVIGAIGPQGPAGRDGADGRDGVDGSDGAPGADGRDGADGKDGANGINGVNGTNGRDGADGKDGVDGSSCSASQDGSSVVITCADGTSAFLPGAGSVIVAQGSDGVTPDISNIPLNFYVIDGNNDPIATFLSGSLPLDVASIIIAGASSVPNLEAVLQVDTEAEQVILTSASSTYLYWLHYTSEDCSGPAFITQPGLRWVTEISRDVYGRPTSKIRTYWKSRRKPGYFRGAYVPPSDVCEPIDAISEAILLQPYEPPRALLNPTFPLTVDSLP